MRLSEKLNCIPDNCFFSEINTMLDHAEIAISPSGEKLIKIAPYEGSIEIDLLADKYLNNPVFDLYKQRGLKERRDAYKLWGRIKRLYKTIDGRLDDNPELKKKVKDLEIVNVNKMSVKKLDAKIKAIQASNRDQADKDREIMFLNLAHPSSGPHCRSCSGDPMAILYEKERKQDLYLFMPEEFIKYWSPEQSRSTTWLPSKEDDDNVRLIDIQPIVRLQANKEMVEQAYEKIERIGKISVLGSLLSFFFNE